jgi:parallel beta-helix repeat protein
MDRKTWTWSLLVISLLLVVWSSSEAQPRQMLSFSAPSAMRLTEAGIYDLRGQVVSCRNGQLVGLLVGRGVELSNVTVEDCGHIGILAMNNSQGGAGADAFATPAPPTTIRQVIIRNTLICIWLAGDGALAESNSASACQYGFHVSGHGNSVLGNTIQDNMPKGVFLVGKNNLIQGNIIRRNGTGIHVYSDVPIDRPNRPLYALEDPAEGNVITENTFSQNVLDMWDAKRTNCANQETWLNAWSANAFVTKKPTCLQ